MSLLLTMVMLFISPEAPQEKPSSESDKPIELVVTGQQDGYRVQEATTGTKTDTPLRDIPTTH